MNKNTEKWHVVNFVGSNNAESRGIVDLLAIRKDHRTNNSKIKRGALFEAVLIQVKGGRAPFSNRRRHCTVETGIQISPLSNIRKITKYIVLLPKCTQCVNLSADEAYKLEYRKESETQRIKRHLF